MREDGKGKPENGKGNCLFAIGLVTSRKEPPASSPFNLYSFLQKSINQSTAGYEKLPDFMYYGPVFKPIFL